MLKNCPPLKVRPFKSRMMSNSFEFEIKKTKTVQYVKRPLLFCNKKKAEVLLCSGKHERILFHVLFNSELFGMTTWEEGLVRNEGRGYQSHWRNTVPSQVTLSSLKLSWKILFRGNTNFSRLLYVSHYYCYLWVINVYFPPFKEVWILIDYYFLII